MISTDSYHSDGAVSTRVLDALEGHQTDADFRAMIDKNKFLAECKAKKFKHLGILGCEMGKERLGRIPQGKSDYEEVMRSEANHHKRRDAALQAKELREAGMTYARIEEITGLKHQSCMLAWKRYGISVKQPESKPLRDKDGSKRKLAHLTAVDYRSGMNLEAISKKYQLDRVTVKNYWKAFDLNVKMRSNRDLAAVSIADILKFCNEEGYRPVEVARMHNVSRGQISKRMKAAGYSYNGNKQKYYKTNNTK